MILCKISLVEDLKAALREVEEGKTKPLDELVRKLNLEELDMPKNTTYSSIY